MIARADTRYLIVVVDHDGGWFVSAGPGRNEFLRHEGFRLFSN